MKKVYSSFIALFILMFVLTACSSDIAEGTVGSIIDENEQLLIENYAVNSDINDSESEDISVASEHMIEVTSFDGYTFIGRLTLPECAENVRTLVIFVNSSGPNTYLNRRTGFNFFDFFADEFSERGIAFFSHNTRGVSVGDTPPLYVEINEEKYQTYLPLNSVEDIYHIVKTLRSNERLANSKVYLLGMSEGTIIAPLFAETYPDIVDGLFLWGYVNVNLRDVLIWQNTGGPHMVWYRAHFEHDEQGRISREAFEAVPSSERARILGGNVSFEDIDINNDGYITYEDFIDIWVELVGHTVDDILYAIESRDDQWLKTNYGGGILPLTSGWFLQHFGLRSNMEVLPGLDLPIHIFHGALDQNVDVREVYRVYARFQELGKTNLTIHTFDGHDHNLNFIEIMVYERIPDGIQAILDAISAA